MKTAIAITLIILFFPIIAVMIWVAGVGREYPWYKAALCGFMMDTILFIIIVLITAIVKLLDSD